ncbi:LTA synthase family protein [Campylobacter sp. MG1]|uniref:LTA synthase family protein n=1 Tax=Campylobacter sp. MG1 TaxID=2976332 RepID=UPI00226D0462|nr:sulfatase-like hydrolase/transferase [Campylobacter sp. MG1]
MSHTIKSFIIFCFFILVCFLFRLIFLLLNFDFSIADMFKSIFSGIRFDSQFCAGFASFYFLFGIIHKKIAKIIFFLISILLIIPELIFYVFFKIYNKKIDSDLFLFKNENFYALFNTALKENYGILPAFISFFIIIVIFYIFYKFINKINIKSNKINTIITVIAFILTMLFTINQQFSLKARSLLPLMPNFNNHILNVSTFGHLINFYSTLKEEYKASKINFNSFNIGTPKETACNFFNISPCKDKINLYDYIKHTKTDEKMIKPKKIYYIISESLSNWVVDERFNDLFNDINNLKNKAAYIPALHNAAGTIRSLESQFLGVQIDNYEIFKNYSKIKSYKQSLSYNAKNLGYNINFYFGGSKNWANTEDAGKIIGIDKFYGKSDMKKYFNNKNISGAWGVYDNYLFDFIQNNNNLNSLNIIMTTTNHPPYDMSFIKHTKIDIPFNKINNLNKKYKNQISTIYWYQKALINWIEETAKNEPDSLFVITGDHYGRFNIDDSNDLFITHSVPVIMYYPKAKIYPTCKITNHLDISASIINLIAPKGYEYFSFGSPCFSLEKKEILAANKYGFEVEFKDGKITSGGGVFENGSSTFLVFDLQRKHN